MKSVRFRGLQLERRAVVAEADDHCAHVEATHGLEQQLHTLVLDQLAEVDDGRVAADEEALETRCVRLVREPLVGVARIRRIEARLLEQRCERSFAFLQHELVDVDAGWDLDHAVDVADHVLEHVADVPRADVRDVGSLERLARRCLELGPATERVLELRPVRLDAVGQAGCGTHRTAHQHMVREHEVGSPERA